MRETETPLRRSWRDRFLVVAFLAAAIFISVPWNAYVAEQTINDFRLVDRSWEYDMAYELGRGRLLGRDYTFTRGPLYQVIHASGWLIPPGNAASVVRWRRVPEATLTILLAWAMLRTMGAPLLWHLGIFTCWTLLVAAPDEFSATVFKPMGGLAWIVLIGSLLAALATRFRRGGAAALIVASVVGGPVLSLYSFEFGIFAIAALLASASWILLTTLTVGGAPVRRLRVSAILAMFAAAAGVAAFVFPGLVSPAWNTYLRDNLETLQGYGFVMSMSLSWSYLASLLGIGLLNLIALFRLTARLRESLVADQRFDGASVILICAIVFSGFMLRFAITRADMFHWWSAVVPTVFVWGGILPSWLAARRSDGLPDRSPPRRASHIAPAALALASCGLFALTGPILAAWDLRLDHLQRLSLRPACLEIDSSEALIREASAAVASLPDESVYIWPYEVIFCMAADKVNPTYTVGTVFAHTDPLERAVVERLEPIEDLPVVVCRATKPLGDVMPITRTPLVFRYLLNRFELAAPPTPQIALLRPAATERRWLRESLADLESPRTFQPGDARGVRIELDDARVSDLLAIRLRVATTRMWGFGKPGRIMVILFHADGSHALRRVLASPDGESHDVLLSELDVSDPFFMTNFSPDRAWRASERITEMVITWDPIDMLSMRPAEITIEDVSRWRREGVDVLETPLARQDDPAVWAWCYENGPRPPVSVHGPGTGSIFGRTTMPVVGPRPKNVPVPLL